MNRREFINGSAGVMASMALPLGETLPSIQQQKPEDRSAKRIGYMTDEGLAERWSGIWGDIVDWGYFSSAPYGWRSPLGSHRIGKLLAGMTFFSKETAHVAKGLLQASGVDDLELVYPIQKVASVNLLKFSDEASKTFYECLCSLDIPVVMSPLVFMLTFKPQTVRRQVQMRIRSFEAFAKRYPSERDLSGYARLYEVSLRVAWLDDFDTTLRRVEALLRDYADTPRICIMALWYKGLLQARFRKSEAQATFSLLATQYQNNAWWIVGASKVLAKDTLPDFSKQKHTSFEEEESWKPFDHDRIIYNIQTFFVRQQLLTKDSISGV